MLKRRLLCVFLLFSTLFLLCACKTEPPSTNGFLKTDFSAELCGASNGLDFCLTVSVENCEGGRSCRMTYITPPELAGVEIALLCSPDGIGVGTATVRSPHQGVFEVSTAAVEGLCLPLYSLLQSYETLSLQKNGQDYLFSCSDGSSRLFSDSGIPISLTREDISWKITWFE